MWEAGDKTNHQKPGNYATREVSSPLLLDRQTSSRTARTPWMEFCLYIILRVYEIDG